MIVIVIWFVILFCCWNHRLYKAHAQLTWNTLYHREEPNDWKQYLVYEKMGAGFNFP